MERGREKGQGAATKDAQNTSKRNTNLFQKEATTCHHTTAPTIVQNQNYN